MSRAVVLLVALFLFRTILPRRKRRYSPAMSPYHNSLDGALSPHQVSAILDDIHSFPSLTSGHTEPH